MPRIRIIWQLYPSFLLIILVSMLAVSWYAYHSLRQFYLDELRNDLQARAVLVKANLTQLESPLHPLVVDDLCKSLGEMANTRITVVLRDGAVIGESHSILERMENHASRPEIAQALRGEIGHSVRRSDTLDRLMMYVAVPIETRGEVIGAVRCSFESTAIDDALKQVLLRIVPGVLMIALLISAVSLWVSRRISRPLEELKRGAQRFAHGELGERLPVPHFEEIGGLAETMNQMAAQLDDRIRTITRQNNEQEAILASMREGVVAVDQDERIITINQAAIDLFGITSPPAQGQSLYEIIGNEDLHRVVFRALRDGQPFEDEIILGEENPLFLRVNGASLRDAEGERIGAVVVLNDMSRLRRLEHLRSEFVANVSHELKTPITSIKGFVETLLDGAMRDPQDAIRFLGIIAKQSDRLHAIIEDLLSLSRIEQDVDKDAIPLVLGRLRDALHSAIESCEAKADEKSMRIDLLCDENLEARINAPLLEQAVVNLIDNAIKYSDPHKRVLVETRRGDLGLEVRVQDWGGGIPREHLQRLFERFYRVDKARSRKMGGTGLGLAIVKHIAQAHNGSVTVESAIGQGSVFTIHLPYP